VEKTVRFGNVGESIGAGCVLAVMFGFCAWLAFYLLSSSDGWGFWSVMATIGAVIFGAMLYFFPTLVAFDVSGRIEEVKEIRDCYPEVGIYKEITVSHQYFWIIFIGNLFFGATGVVWLVLFFWAHAPGTVIIPDVIVTKIKEKNQPDKELKPESDLESKPEAEPEIEPALEFGTRTYAFQCEGCGAKDSVSIKTKTATAGPAGVTRGETIDVDSATSCQYCGTSHHL
jgi:hypothetical protein